MKNIVLFLLLTSSFLEISESTAKKALNKRKPKPNWYIDVRVHEEPRGYCKYHNLKLPVHSVNYFANPCEVIVCSHDGTEVSIKGCPAFKNTTPSFDEKRWPNCCPGWHHEGN
uniref:Putative 8.9 kDa family member n=1 Tax=Rhipicephalus pulchellus TaxID=72859 RepID=L7MCA6_RHIPC